MAEIEDYEPIADDNDATPPAGAPEGMAPSAVNDAMREHMARSRRWWDVIHGGRDRGHLAGLTLANNGSDATNDIDIAVGQATDSAQGAIMVLGSVLTKRLDAGWAVGTNQGGLDTGSIANTTYHVYLIRRPDTGVVDALFSTSASAPTMPADYTQKRRIGSIIRSGGAIVAFRQSGDRFLRDAAVLDVNTTNPGTSAVTPTLSVPTGISVVAMIAILLSDATPATTTYARVSSLSQSDAAVGPSNFNFGINAGSGATSDSSPHGVETNASGQIRYRLENSTADHAILITTQGWLDRRGRDD